MRCLALLAICDLKNWLFFHLKKKTKNMESLTSLKNLFRFHHQCCKQIMAHTWHSVIASSAIFNLEQSISYRYVSDPFKQCRDNFRLLLSIWGDKQTKNSFSCQEFSHFLKKLSSLLIQNESIWILSSLMPSWIWREIIKGRWPWDEHRGETEASGTQVLN